MTALARVPARTIVCAIADAAQRWSNADFPPRVRATDRIAERTGYSMPVVQYALDRLFFSMTPQDIEATICRELGSLEILDGFVPRTGGPDTYASPSGSACIISSRTTIGVALVPAIFALCAKCDVLVKDREDALAGAFFESLAQELEALRAAAQAKIWGSAGDDAPDLGSFGTVVAFGNDATLARIMRGVAPQARFVGYGSRASAGYVARESLDEPDLSAIAQGAARDLVLYESEGCLSLHVLFVERGAHMHPREFAARLAEAVTHAGIEFPIGGRDPAATASIAQLRDATIFRAASEEGSAVFSNAAAEFAVLYAPPLDQPPPFLPRSLGVIPVDGPGEALAYLRAHHLPLEGFALSTQREDVTAMALAAGAVRLTRFGELQHPPLGCNHGGHPRIAPFVRWIDRTL